ncbi:MAG: rhodanese-like domain-containing protein [Oscillospiraceae bacterium]|nr:rhodanese-like domain-containing protein [Oscillospiraceae bacterium]
MIYIKMAKKIFIMLLCGFILSSCDSKKGENGLPPKSEGDSTSKEEVAQAVYRRITPEEAHDLMQSAEDFILLDVRTAAEHGEQRIPGSVLLPYDEIEGRAKAELPDKNALILVYCRSGRRSETAAKQLVDMGYANVYDFGGIIEWKYDTESD